MPVNNPMTEDLDGGGNQIQNVSGVAISGNETSIGANYVGTHELVLSVNPGVLDDPLVTILAGTADPTVTPPGGNAATVFVRWTSLTHRELWFNTGTGWVKVA